MAYNHQIFTETDSMAGNERIGNIPYINQSNNIMLIFQQTLQSSQHLAERVNEYNHSISHTYPCALYIYIARSSSRTRKGEMNNYNMHVIIVSILISHGIYNLL